MGIKAGGIVFKGQWIIALQYCLANIFKEYRYEKESTVFNAGFAVGQL
jgi:hypothetical protein